MFNKSIISLLTILIILSSCARNPKEISLNETKERVEKDILKIEQIKKENETWEDNIKIDLYTAIALAIKNNRELKIKQLETGIAYRKSQYHDSYDENWFKHGEYRNTPFHIVSSFLLPQKKKGQSLIHI